MCRTSGPPDPDRGGPPPGFSLTGSRGEDGGLAARGWAVTGDFPTSPPGRGEEVSRKLFPRRCEALVWGRGRALRGGRGETKLGIASEDGGWRMGGGQGGGGGWGGGSERMRSARGLRRGWEPQAGGAGGSAGKTWARGEVTYPPPPGAPGRPRAPLPGWRPSATARPRSWALVGGGAWPGPGARNAICRRRGRSPLGVGVDSELPRPDWR